VIRWLIVIEVIVTIVQDKSFQMRPRFEAHGDTATRLPRGYRVALYMGLQDFAFGLISPSISVQAFGYWNKEQLLHS
jgi:hypothetical protein